MKLIVTTVLSWLAGVAAHLLPTYMILKEPVNLDDLIGIAVLSVAALLPVCFLIYLPGLFWLRRRLPDCRPLAYFPLLAASLFNLPVLVGLGLLYRFAGAFAPEEAMLFGFQFIIAGAVFGAGFVWHSRTRFLQNTASATAT